MRGARARFGKVALVRHTDGRSLVQANSTSRRRRRFALRRSFSFIMSLSKRGGGTFKVEEIKGSKEVKKFQYFSIKVKEVKNFQYSAVCKHAGKVEEGEKYAREGERPPAWQLIKSWLRRSSGASASAGAASAGAWELESGKCGRLFTTRPLAWAYFRICFISRVLDVVLQPTSIPEDRVALTPFPHVQLTTRCHTLCSGSEASAGRGFAVCRSRGDALRGCTD